MKKNLLVGFAVSAGMLFGSVGAASAGSDNHNAPGTPGEKNCSGQTMAYLAQLDLGDSHGIGGLADLTGLSVKEIRTIVDDFCG